MYLNLQLLDIQKSKTFDFTTMVPQVELFSFVFWENWRHLKRHFEINWPLICAVNFMHSFVTTKLARVLKICTKTQAPFYFIWHLKRSKSTYATKYVCALCTYYSRAITYTNHVYEAIGLKRDASKQWSQCIFKVAFISSISKPISFPIIFKN